MDYNVKLHKHISIWWQYPSSGQEAMYLDLIVSNGRGITTLNCAGTTYQYLGWWPPSGWPCPCYSPPLRANIPCAGGAVFQSALGQAEEGCMVLP